MKFSSLISLGLKSLCRGGRGKKTYSSHCYTENVKTSILLLQQLYSDCNEARVEVSVTGSKFYSLISHDDDIYDLGSHIFGPNTGSAPYSDDENGCSCCEEA